MHAFTRAERRRQLTRYLADRAGQARCGVGTPTACTAAAKAAKNLTCLASPRCRATGEAVTLRRQGSRAHISAHAGVLRRKVITAASPLQLKRNGGPETPIPRLV